MKFYFILLFLLIPLRLYSSLTVDLFDPVYIYLERLEGNGYLDSYIHGARILNRNEIAYLILEYKSKLDANQMDETTHSLLNRIEEDYKWEISNINDKKRWIVHEKCIDKVNLEITYLGAKKHPIDMAQLDADVNYFMENNEGREYVNGLNISLESSHWVNVGDIGSISIQPRIPIYFEEFSSMSAEFTIHKYSLNLISSNYFGIQMGKDSIAFGQGRKNNLIVSTNSEPFKTIGFYAKTPKIPYLGVARLNFSQNFLKYNDENIKNPSLLGGNLSIKFPKYLEIGASHFVQWGGAGAPEFGLWQGFLEFWFMRKKEGDLHVLGIANHEGMVNFRVYLPELNNLQFFFEIGVEDKYEPRNLRAIKNLFYYSSGYDFGFYFPKLDNNGNFDLLFEVTKLPHRLYTHGLYTDGFTHEGRIIGSPLGPESLQFSLESRYIRDINCIWIFSFDYFDRGRDVYLDTTQADELANFELMKKQSSEYEGRLTVQYLRDISKKINLNIIGGYGFVYQYNYEVGNNDHNLFFKTLLQYKF